MPTVVIASADFEEFSLTSAQTLGLAEARILTVPHPIGGVPNDVLRQRAEDRVELVMSMFGEAAPSENEG